MSEWKPGIGKSYIIDSGERNPNNKKIHILAVVDEEYYVYKHWQKHKQHWNYNVEHLSYLQMLYKNSYLK